MKISLFADLVCPWCYLGATRLERAAATYTLEAGDPVEISLRAFQLDPDTPSDATPVLDTLAEKFGTREQADQEAGRVVEEARSDGLDLDLTHAVRANTFDAHRMLAWAEAADGTRAQRDLAHELWRAHFAEGADIADHDTLAARAAAAGLDPEAADQWLASSGGSEEVRMQRDAARSARITTVPTAVVEAKYAVSGAQPQDTYLQVLHEVARQLDTG